MGASAMLASSVPCLQARVTTAAESSLGTDRNHRTARAESLLELGDLRVAPRSVAVEQQVRGEHVARGERVSGDVVDVRDLGGDLLLARGPGAGERLG